MQTPAESQERNNQSSELTVGDCLQSLPGQDQKDYLEPALQAADGTQTLVEPQERNDQSSELTVGDCLQSPSEQDKKIDLALQATQTCDQSEDNLPPTEEAVTSE